MSDPDPQARDARRPSLAVVVREWGRIGCVGFGGPPTHIKLLRELCVERRRWLTPVEFEDAVAACNLLPGPASTQLAIFCAWRVRCRRGALLGGAAFIVPGLVLILALSATFLAGAPPRAIPAAGAGAGSAVAAVAVHAATGLLPASWHRARDDGRANRLQWSATSRPGCSRRPPSGPGWCWCWWPAALSRSPAAGAATPPGRPRSRRLPVLALGTLTLGTLASWIWVAFKVGALSYGGGFVIVPLMQNDAVNHYHWMTGSQFLNAVALGQITPGPVVQTVAVVGYAAAGLLGGVLAAVVAFSPSFMFVLLGARHFDQLRTNTAARAFLEGAGPAAILGSAITLARALTEPWQYAVLAAAAVALLVLRRGVVLTLLTAATTGIMLVSAGLALPQ
jgi:chromate transporter